IPSILNRMRVTARSLKRTTKAESHDSSADECRYSLKLGALESKVDKRPSVGQLNAVGMLLLTLVLVSQNLLQPESLTLCGFDVDGLGLMKNNEGLPASITAKRAHIFIAGRLLAHLPLFNRNSVHEVSSGFLIRC